jgi:hypothetical protein
MTNPCVTDAGAAWITDKIDGTSALKPDYIGWGSGAGTATQTDTTLSTEETETRIGPVGSGVTASQPTTKTNRYVGTMTAAAGKTITNAGLFTAVTGPTLVVHGSFTGVVLATGDKIDFTIDIVLTN